jgi:mono/diheme cytochrome c family protein
MRTPRALLAGLLLVVAATVAAACGGSGGSAPPTPTDPVLARGAQIYSQKCASCHGKGGGGGMGPKLAGVVANRYPDIADQMAVIRDGRSSMPGFGGSSSSALSDDDIEAVARYEREVLGSS